MLGRRGRCGASFVAAQIWFEGWTWCLVGGGLGRGQGGGRGGGRGEGQAGAKAGDGTRAGRGLV